MASWVVHNWPLKLAALAAASAVWFFVMTTEKTRLVVTAPIEWVGLGDERMLVGPRPDAVDIEFEAVRWVAPRLEEMARVRVNVLRLPEGESVVALTPGDVEAPRGVAVRRVTPARLRVTVARAERRSVRVAPELIGVPAAGYVVGHVSAEPATVQIKGPRSTIEGRDAITTAPVDVTGSRQTVSRTVGLMLPDSVEPERERTVRVTVEIRAEERMQQHRGARR